MPDRKPIFERDDWYWIVAGSTTHVYSSARDALVPNDDAAHLAWLAAGRVPTRIATQAELDEVLAWKRDEADARSARQYAKLAALRQMTPAQVSAWVDSNVTNLATAQDAIKTLAIAVAVLARRL